MVSRGIRNNNPGNIDRNATKWQGMAPDQSSDPRFVVFTDPKWGIRAIARLMLTYSNQYGLHTVKGLVGRWAPPSENNTASYISAVCGAMKAAGLPDDPDAEIDVDSAAVMTVLVRGIILHENASDPYPDSVISEGIRLAGVADAKPSPLHTQHTFQAQAGAAGTLVLAGATHVASFAPTVKGWADQLGEFTGSPIIQHAVTVLLTVAGGLTLVGIALQFLKQKAA